MPHPLSVHSLVWHWAPELVSPWLTQLLSGRAYLKRGCDVSPVSEVRTFSGELMVEYNLALMMPSPTRLVGGLELE